MSRNPYADDIIISWVELHRDARYLSEMLHAIGTWKGIIAITRGGLVPAALVARELEIGASCTRFEKTRVEFCNYGMDVLFKSSGYNISVSDCYIKEFR